MCPLNCEKQFNTKEELINHQNKCENNFENCLNCDEYILKKMQGAHDCVNDLKEACNQKITKK